ncbi:Hypothetical predicted protein [Paramuricea clavata]|uniref:Uncharacterized protein n=1 Tax=Paramuricea clavata TaxID=317549 RepID=A0A6S7HKL2_PARCT|nr:Hypothetical predicted protein [Paramuricea clavata]
MAIFKALCLIGFVLLSSGYARKHEARHGSRFRHDYGFHRYKQILKRHESGDGNPRNGGSTQRASTGVAEVRAKGALEFLPNFETFQSGEIDGGVEFKVTEGCSVTVSKTGTLYQLGSSPPDCVNLANLLDFVLPNGKANFEFDNFMTLDRIIIRTFSLDTATKQVDIAAAYTGTATLIQDILTLSNLRVELSFVWAQSQTFTFDIRGTFTFGDVPVDVRLIRNEEGALEFLPNFETFQSGEIDGGVEFKVTEGCSVTVSKTGTLYQLGSSPPDCVNLANLLDFVLPNGKANFEFDNFMTLDRIIIRTFSLDTATKQVDIAAAYTGTATLIQDILTLSNLRVELSFVWAQSQTFTFDIRGTFTFGDVPVDVRLIRNEEGYNFAATVTENLNAAAISSMFKQEDSFLPSTSLDGPLKEAKFDKFEVIKPRIQAIFADGYGFLFSGSIRILDWDLFDVNILINKPNDLPTTVTIAVFTKTFSISKMFKDLFKMDISDVPVLGSAVVRNLAFSLSTGDVDTPLTVLDIGDSDDIFEVPYSKGLKVSFEIPIAQIYVATSIFISPTLITLTISQSGELNLGHVIREFVPNSNLIVTTEGETKLKNWPQFIPDPLSIALVSFHLEASKPTGSWALTTMNMKLKMTDVISLFNNKIHLSDLELELNYEKGNDPSFYGVVVGRVSLGPTDGSSPTVDVRIPFPFNNDEISFTFTDFNVKSVVEALAGPNVFPKDFPELFESVQLDSIAIAFDDQGSLSTISVDASIPELWPIFGDISIGNVEIHFEYGKGTSGGDGNDDDGTDGDGTDGDGTDGDGTDGDGTDGDGTDGDGNDDDGTDDDGTNGDGTDGDGTGESTTQSTWRVVVRGQIVIATCTITIEADFGTDLLGISAEGAECSVSVGDVLERIGLNRRILPSMISGFKISDPKLRIMLERTGDNAGSKSIAFAATTNLFRESQVELALIRHGGRTAVIAGFAVESDAISEISFLSSLGLTDVAVVFVSEKIPISPYEFLNPSFQHYIQGSPGSPDTPEFQGITIYARFVPKDDNMLGHMLRKGMEKDGNLEAGGDNEPEIIVKISFPALVFELEINLGSDGLQIGDVSGWRLTYMKLIISKRLIGLSLQCKVNMDNKNADSIDSTFTGEVTFTFTGTITIFLLWEGEWNNPFGISKRLTVRRMGLALGINLATLVPSFGITGAISVDVPSETNQPPIDVDLTLCIDPSAPDQTVFDLHFTRLLLEDLINLFAGKVVKLPKKLATVGFPDQVQIYFSFSGNPNCFGKSYDPGVEIHGTIQIPFLKIRARIDLSIALPPAPFRLDASLELDPIIYLGGLIKVVDADTDSKGAYLRMLITENLSDLMIDGSCRIEIFGAMISVNLQINSQKFFFEGRLKYLWGLFEVYLLVDISMVKTSPSLHVIGEMRNDLFAKIKQKATQAIRAGAKAVNAKIEGAQTKIRNAQREVDKLLKSIDDYKKKIEDEKRKCRKAPWYKKLVCVRTAARIVKHGVIIAGYWAAHKAAILVLKAANLFLEGAKGIIKVGTNVLQKLVNAALSIINIRYVRFEIEMNAVTRIFDFNAKIVILGWTFTPEFRIDFSSVKKANSGINSAGQSISDKTMAKVKK